MLDINDKSTFFSKVYPMTKIWLGLGITIGVFCFSNYYISIIIFALSFIIILEHKMLKEFGIVFLAVLILGISLFLIQGILNPENQTVVWQIIPGTSIAFYEEGLLKATNVYARIVPIVAVLFLLVRTMNITELGVALNKAGISYRASFVLSSTFQVIPVFNREMKTIIEAQKSRGLDTEGDFFSRIKAFVPIIFPLISNSIMKVQSQVIALESRGFNSSAKKTYYRNPSKTKYDPFLTIVAIIFASLGVAYRTYIIIS
ncbi:energy-coupling factor transporter transmembrane component T family protein [Virgibacillus sp. W0430]|uniref:energy-coupling factor transporter transmembrane component T family protein n=1 Tax=Virgibacillus sp. W0430 TaxID=3391580 RepID=UPI003F464A79